MVMVKMEMNIKIILNNQLYHLKYMLISNLFWKALKVTIIIMLHTPKRYQSHISCSFAYKVVFIDDIFSTKIILYRGEIAIYKFIEVILKEYDYCKSVTKKHFNKICYICRK